MRTNSIHSVQWNKWTRKRMNTTQQRRKKQTATASFVTAKHIWKYVFFLSRQFVKLLVAEMSGCDWLQLRQANSKILCRTIYHSLFQLNIECTIKSNWLLPQSMISALSTIIITYNSKYLCTHLFDDSHFLPLLSLSLSLSSAMSLVDSYKWLVRVWDDVVSSIQMCRQILAVILSFGVFSFEHFEWMNEFALTGHTQYKIFKAFQWIYFYTNNDLLNVNNYFGVFMIFDFVLWKVFFCSLKISF